jgi:hypothetical protein
MRDRAGITNRSLDLEPSAMTQEQFELAENLGREVIVRGEMRRAARAVAGIAVQWTWTYLGRLGTSADAATNRAGLGRQRCDLRLVGPFICRGPAGGQLMRQPIGQCGCRSG